MWRKSRIYSLIVFMGIGMLLTGCKEKIPMGNSTHFKSNIMAEECILCNKESSVYEKPDTILGLYNVNTGEEINLMLGNSENSVNTRESGRKEIHFPEKGGTTVQFFSFKGRDMCEVTLYTGAKSGIYRKAEEKMCDECGETLRESVCEYVILDHINREFYPIKKNGKLTFAGDYGIHFDWEEDAGKMEILLFYSEDICCKQ